MSRPLRVALLTHSTNPRGGVVHALELAEALTALGHEAVVHAPDPEGRGFFRRTRCGTVSVPVPAVGRDAGDDPLVATVRARIAGYVAHFGRQARPFDVYHAGDPIGANALADLAGRGLIPGFVRTVHHLDAYDHPWLDAWQRRSVTAADRVVCVSDLWRRMLERDHGVRAVTIRNGVDTRRFRPGAPDEGLRDRLGIDGGDWPILLAVGGVEERKNTVRILEAFLLLQGTTHPDARLVIAGGASLLDHGAYAAAFRARLAAAGPAAAGRVLVTGPIRDADMPGLFRLADALLFPSLREGFGLVALEAMACGTPAVVSRVPPFTEHLGEGECAFADPLDPGSIADAARRALADAPALRRAGLQACGRLTWEAAARRHVDLYRDLLAEPGRRPVPEMRFAVRWPDQTSSECYSPSLVVKDFLEEGGDYPLDDFVARAREALGIASERVRARYGFPCGRARAQSAAIEAAAARFAGHPDPRVTVLAFRE